MRYTRPEEEPEFYMPQPNYPTEPTVHDDGAGTRMGFRRERTRSSVNQKRIDKLFRQTGRKK